MPLDESQPRGCPAGFRKRPIKSTVGAAFQAPFWNACVFRPTWARVPEALGHPFRQPGQREELTAIGAVGEDTNKLIVYLVATSRLPDDPLALLMQSTSGPVRAKTPAPESHGPRRTSSKDRWGWRTELRAFDLTAVTNVDGRDAASAASRTARHCRAARPGRENDRCRSSVGAEPIP